MRQVVLQIMTTLNGRIDDPGAWVTDISDDHYADIDRLYAEFDTVLAGGATYQEMVGYWLTAAEEAGASATVKSMAHKMNTYKKYIFTRRGESKPLEWNNAEQVAARTDQDLMRFVTALKAQPGKAIHLAGGAALVQSFTRLGLVDEYRLFAYPVVSAGKTWFDAFGGKQSLTLIQSTVYSSGVVGLFYRPEAAG